ncbi:hypothetical protein [Epilithonimonas hungarica]|uniref:Uncharacterized protein n=1 Tax=Epilithonimonas hungarica TaxID=454006 RepID=A0A1G7TMK3_9FLAO|nr:hypothetical protein [Epilithonimonas hungarica]SDG36505.1 hypothetical protein SAMN05421825_3165 [Epilithonimonas hungarica]
MIASVNSKVTDYKSATSGVVGWAKEFKQRGAAKLKPIIWTTQPKTKP